MAMVTLWIGVGVGAGGGGDICVVVVVVAVSVVVTVVVGGVVGSCVARVCLCCCSIGIAIDVGSCAGIRECVGVVVVVVGCGL